MSEIFEKDLTGTASAASSPSPKVSVIVPVYKVEKYLPECIESILAQTFTDFELILVDDGSPDNSGKICDDYAKKDSRIRVFHKPNGGVSSARNLGLDHACGEWIAFVDSDDWVERDFLTLLYENTSLPEVDFVFGGFYFDHGVNTQAFLHCVGVFSKEETMVGVLSGKICGTQWCKLLRLALIEAHSIRFKEGLSIGEDMLFIFQYVKKMHKSAGVSQVGYHYVFRGDSAFHSVSPQRFLDQLKAIELLELEIGTMPVKEYSQRKRAQAKFTVIRSGVLSRKEINEKYGKRVNSCGLPIVKRIVLKLYPTSLWHLISPVFFVLNKIIKTRET